MCRGFESLLRYQNAISHVAKIIGISLGSILRAIGCCGLRHLDVNAQQARGSTPMFLGLYQVAQ